MSLFSQSCEIAVVSSHLTDKVDKNMRDFPVVPEKFLNPWVHVLAQILDHCSCLSLQYLKVELMLWWFVHDRFISWDTVCNPARCASGSRMCVWGTYVAHWYDWVETLTDGATQANEKAVILYIQMCILNAYLGLKGFFYICSENIQILMTISVTPVLHFLPGNSAYVNFKLNFCSPFPSLYVRF